MSFRFDPLGLDGLVLVTSTIREDARGTFSETFRQSAFRARGIGPFVQDNAATSSRGVLRGLHFQRSPHQQGKLLRVAAGEVFDVAVDLRAAGDGFGRWISLTLRGGGPMLYVPEGFAHGYQVLTDQATVEYKVTTEYAPESEGGLRWDDPKLEIEWPLPISGLSSRDSEWPGLDGLAAVF